MEVGVGCEVEWCIVGVVVGVVMVLWVLVLMIMEGSISVSTPPSSLPSRPRRQAPPLSRTTLVTAAVMLLAEAVAAVGGAVQRVSAGVALVEAATRVALLPGAMRARGAHARGRTLEGERQESRTLRRRGQRRRRVFLRSVHIFPLLFVSTLLQT